MKTIEQFCGYENGYSVSKTLRNELRPVGKTLHHIRESGFIERDTEKNKWYPVAKKIIDECHKRVIERVLSNSHLIWDDLAEAINVFRKLIGGADARDFDSRQRAKEEVEKQSARMRELIYLLFKSDADFKLLFGKELFKKLLPKLDLSKTPFSNEDREIVIKEFGQFTTYFTGFYENRENVYKPDEIATAIGYRLVHENFPRFLSNIALYKKLKSDYPDLMLQAEKNLKEILQKDSLDDYFAVDGFNKTLSQTGIDRYNALLGGIAGEQGTKKIQGINELINLKHQQLTSTGKGALKGKMNILYKQILSDRINFSFTGLQFSDEKELWAAVKETAGALHPAIVKALVLSDLLKSSDLKKVYVTAASISDMSLSLYDQWDIFHRLLNRKKENAISELKTKKEKEGVIREYEKRKVYSMYELIQLIEENAALPEDSKITLPDVTPKMYLDILPVKAKAVETNYQAVLPLSEKDYGEISLSEQQNDIDVLKLWLDSVQEFYQYLKVFDVSDDFDKDSDFYSEFDSLLQQIKVIIPLYNKVRNYVTKKPGAAKNIKMNFDCPTLADGWDLNKESGNLATLFLKDRCYYLGILNPHNKPKFGTYTTENGESFYKKMVYKYLPGPNKMLPKVFFSEKGLPVYKPSPSLLENYKKGKHKKTEADFDLAFCHELIDFFKDSIARNPDWSVFNFRFSPTSSYRDIGQFYKEITEQAYKIDFLNIPERVIDEMVENGQLFLFQIYNKDFAAGATGRKNLHTLYWENVFSEENLRDIVIKLNGEAELFYRPVRIKKIQKHVPGEKLVNRITKSGMPIDDTVYRELFLDANGRLTEPLSEDAQRLKDSGEVVIKEVSHELIKDRRYTEEKFLFHCPITFNYKSLSPVNLNLKTRAALAKSHDVKVIGLDRGERHLIYLSLIDGDGKILKQKSFNLIEVEKGNTRVGINYHDKLEQMAYARNQARINWKTIGNIKEMKEGYLSQVVHEIAEMMVEENAIVVMEDLNFGFKRGRFKVEQQVYQKFEKMLIDKLNYLTFKDRPVTAPGGILNGYQLAAPFESFKMLGKQSGWLFYIPAWNTSKIDPVTGFINQFKTNDLTNMEKKAAFFSQFDSFVYHAGDDSFHIAFRYSRFINDVLGKDEWILSSRGKRILYSPKKKEYFDFEPTREFKQIFTAQGISWENGNDILPMILSVPKEKANASFFDSLLRTFNAVLQMRNSNARTGEDYILSPVADADGCYFDSRDSLSGLPDNADANGAFNIARKGLWILEQLHAVDASDEKALKSIKLAISNRDWIEFVQQR